MTIEYGKTNTKSESTTNLDSLPLSKKPLGYLLALIGGSLGGVVGMIASPLTLFILGRQKLPVAKGAAHPNIFKSWATIGVVGAPLCLALGGGFNSDTTVSSSSATNSSIQKVTTVSGAINDHGTKSISTINLAKYCKQLVGDLMGRDPNIMVTGQVTADIVSISYVRADDAKEFKYQCKEDEGNIIWRGVDIFGPGEGPGRWRNEDARPVSTFI